MNISCPAFVREINNLLADFYVLLCNKYASMAYINKKSLFILSFFIFSFFELKAQCGNSIQLGPDTTLCSGQTLVLNAASVATYNSYLWDNTSTNPTRTVSTAGTYNVTGTFLGGNLIVNGDFESGNVGFTTDYIIGTGGTYGLLSSAGQYAIATSPSLAHTNFTPCTDHTPAPGTSMLVVNGSGTPGSNVWCQTVSVQPNTDYQFGTWITNALYDVNVAQLQFSINGSSLGNVFATSTIGCNWEQFFQVWNSGSATTAVICILNQNTINAGNDFAIDDITFRPVCYSIDSIVVSYSTFPVVNLGVDTNLCSGTTLTLDAQNTGSSYLWTGGSTNQTLNVQTTGNYKVIVTNTDFCQKSDSILVTFETPKNAGLDAQTSICVTNGAINLNTLLSPGTTLGGSWYDFDITTNNGLNINGNINISLLNGMHEASYVVTGVYCPNDTSKIQIDVKSQPNAGLDGSSKVCNTFGDLVNLNTLINPPTTTVGIWQETGASPSNQFAAGTGILNISNLSAGIYRFNYVLTAVQPCINDTAKVFVTIVENPIVSFTADKLKGCSPLEVQFTNTSVTSAASTYLWTFGDGTTSSLLNPNLKIYVGAGCYDISLKVTSENLCVKTFSIADMICVDPNPVADFSFSPMPAYADDPMVTFTNSSSLNDFNAWTFGDGTTSTLENPKHLYPLGEVANYLAELIVYTTEGCSDTARRIVQINGQTIFYVPNAFTPDGDELNNIFIPVITAGFDPSDYAFVIYNRWGEIVFETFDIAVGWDGTYGGKIVQDGTYTWTIDFKHISEDNRYVKKGSVNLIR
jgi:gliding motility-associated-like protein